MLRKKQKYYIFTANANIVLIFSSGAIIQTFLYSLGLKAEQIGMYTLCISAVQVITLLLSAFLTDKVKNVPKTMALCTLPSFLFFAIMMFLDLSNGISNKMIYASVIAVCLFWNFFYGIRLVLEYKLPYYVADISEYPYISSVSGVILSALGIIVSGLFVFFSRLFDYKMVICVAFALSMTFGLIAAYMVFSIGNKQCSGIQCSENSKIGFKIFSLPSVKYLAVPYYIRGVSNGIMAMIAVVMLSSVTKDKTMSSSLSTVSAIATAFICFLYAKIYKKVSTQKFILIGGLIHALSLMFLLSGNLITFFITFFIAFSGEVVVDYATPVFITEIVPYTYIGGVSSVRMLLFTAGVATGNYIAGMLSSCHPKLLMIICATAQIVNVVWCNLYGKFRKNKIK